MGNSCIVVCKGDLLVTLQGGFIHQKVWWRKNVHYFFFGMFNLLFSSGPGHTLFCNFLPSSPRTQRPLFSAIGYLTLTIQLYMTPSIQLCGGASVFLWTAPISPGIGQTCDSNFTLLVHCLWIHGKKEEKKTLNSWKGANRFFVNIITL